MLDDLKKTLWATADKLRANMDAAEHRYLVLGPTFGSCTPEALENSAIESTAPQAAPANTVWRHCDNLDDLPAQLLAVEARHTFFVPDLEGHGVHRAVLSRAPPTAAIRPHNLRKRRTAA